MTQPSGSITIRQARETDVQAYRALRLEALRTNPEAFSADYAANAARPIAYWEDRLRVLGSDGMQFFAFHDQEMIGMCGIYRGDSPKTRHSAMIVGVFVRPAWRGQHIAEGLVSQCVEWARSQGVSIVKLAVITTNTAAIRCYARCDFTVYGIEPQALYNDGSMYAELLMCRSFA